METLLKKELKPFRIGDWLILPEINRISGPTGKINVGARTMQVLVYLAQQQGRVVTKEEFLSKVWDDVIVTEDSLIKSISVLRQIFQCSSGKNPKIDTVRAIGYMLLSPVKYVEKKSLIENFKGSKTVTYAAAYFAVALAISGVLFSSAFKEKRDQQDVINVTDDWNQERVPRFSPNGDKIMFAGGTEGWNNMDIYIKNLENSNVSKVVDGEFLETDPIWSPDGNSIAFFRNQGKKISIVTKDLHTSKEKNIIAINAIANLSAMVWSPDDQWIIYVDYPTKGWKTSLYKVNIASGEKIRLTFPDERSIWDLSPRFSPNGRRLAFIRADKPSMLYSHLIPGHGKICIRDDGGEIKNVLNLDSDISGVTWLDDDHLAYATTYNNFFFRIYQLNIHTSEKHLLFETEEIIRNLDYHPKTNKLVFETWNEQYSIWNYTARDQEPNFSGRYLKKAKSNWQPKFHRNTNTVAYISTRSGAAELWIRDKNKDTQLTYFGGAVIRNASWSPNGRSLIFEVNVDDQDDIYQVNRYTKKVSKVLATDHEEKYPYWSEDGQHIYYSSNKSGSFEIWKKNINSDVKDIQITYNGGLRSLEYKGILYYSKPHSRGIWKIADQKEELLVPKFSPNDVGNWDIAQDKLYYLKRGRFWRPEMYQFDLHTEQEEHYQSFSMPVSFTFSGLAIDSDISAILVTHNDRVRSDIKMISRERSTPVPNLISFVSLP